MAKKRKKKKKSPNQAPLKPHNYVKKVARKLPLYGCWVTEDWGDKGIADVIIARQRHNEELVIGFYLIDIWCLGLKDTYFRTGITTIEFEDVLHQMEMAGQPTTPCEPNLAFNLIYGAIEYAEDLGFSTPKEFNITEYILDDVEDIEYIDLQFGKDGRPFYFAGPHDNQEAVLKILEKNVGVDNFDYILPAGENSLNEPSFYHPDFELENFLPQERVLQKVNSLETEEEKLKYMVQVETAGLVLFNYDLNLEELIEEGYDDSLVDSLTEEMMKSYHEKEDTSSEEEPEPDESFEEEVRETVMFVLEKIIEHGGVDFLLAEDFEPMPQLLSEEELSKLSPEEFQEYEQYIMGFFPESKRIYYLISNVASGIMFDKTGEGQAEEISEDLYDEILAELKNTMAGVLERTLTEEDIDYLRGVLDDLVEKYPDLRAEE